MTQSKPDSPGLPPRIFEANNPDDHGTYFSDRPPGIEFLSLQEHQHLLRQARAELWREAKEAVNRSYSVESALDILEKKAAQAEKGTDG